MGPVVVVSVDPHCPAPLPAGWKDDVRADLKAAFGSGTKVVFCPAGVSFTVTDMVAASERPPTLVTKGPLPCSTPG